MNPELFVILAMVFAFGMIYGKCFKKFNPFFILIGSIVFIPTLASIIDQNEPILIWGFGIGFFWALKEKFGFAFNFFDSVKMKTQEINAERQYRQRERESEHQYQEQEQQRQGRAWEEEERRRREEIRRREEELRRQEEELKRQKRQQREEHRKNQERQGQQRPKESSGVSMPKTFAEACEVLEVSTSASFKDTEKAFYRLIDEYHPDSNPQSSERINKYATEKTQQLNEARNITKKHFGK